MFRDSRDVVVSRKVAKACQQPYQVISIGEEFLKEFPHWAERTVYLTDGCASVQQASCLYANARAREIAPVRMTGNYGSEVLRRVRSLKATRPAPELFPELRSSDEQAFQTCHAVSKGNHLSFAVFRQAPWYHYAVLALEETKMSQRSPFLDNELVHTVFRAPESAFTNDIVLWLIEEGNPALRHITSDRGLAAEYPGATAGRMFQEFTFKAEYAYDYGMPQWLARLDGLVAPFRPERLFLGRHKFNHYRVWYRDALSKYVQEMLLDRLTLSRPYLQASTVESMVQGHLSGNSNYTWQIHQVLTLELLNRMLLDSPRAVLHQPVKALAVM
jgi:asparagine synthase (glutamine-hydrolysing)